MESKKIVNINFENYFSGVTVIKRDGSKASFDKTKIENYARARRVAHRRRNGCGCILTHAAACRV